MFNETGQLEQDNLDKAAKDRIARAGQPGQVTLEKLVGNVSRIMSAWTRQRGEDAQIISARTGLERTTGTGQLW
jgi:hypothetical protein